MKSNTINDEGGRVITKITADTKQDQRMLAEAIRKGLGIKAQAKEGDEGK